MTGRILFAIVGRNGSGQMLQTIDFATLDRIREHIRRAPAIKQRKKMGDEQPEKTESEIADEN